MGNKIVINNLTKHLPNNNIMFLLTLIIPTLLFLWSVYK